MKPIAYINVEKRTLEFAKKIFWHTPTVANLDRIPLFTKEALAQTQEPVAWMLDGEFYKTQQFHLQGGHYANQIPLYTTPPQRTWVGLTNEEKSKLWEVSRAALPRYATYAILIEDKLKQKNGYAEENT